jgi:hypothetical protein
MTRKLLDGELPRLPWWVRLHIWMTYVARPGSGNPRWPSRADSVPPDVQCLIWGCTEVCVVRSWRRPIRRIYRPNCPHQ